MDCVCNWSAARGKKTLTQSTLRKEEAASLRRGRGLRMTLCLSDFLCVLCVEGFDVRLAALALALKWVWYDLIETA